MQTHNPSTPPGAIAREAPAGATRALLLAAVAMVALGAFALNDQSLWTDELGTWRLTVAASWADWFAQLVGWPNSDAQIPFYHLYMRTWVQFFPSTETWLRAANLPWIFVAFAAVLSTPVPAPQRRQVLILAGVLLLHPMVWYYTNEARPYAMIFAGACVAASGLLARLALPDRSAALPAANGRLIIGTAIMAGTSVIGVIWSVTFLLPVLGTLRRRAEPTLAAAVQFTTGNAILALACALLLLPIAYQYAWSFLHGVSATAYHENSLLNFAFGLYEIAGFDGIGPGREQLRAIGASGLRGNLAPLLAYGVVIGAALAWGLREGFRRNRRQALLILFSAFLPLAILFVLGSLKHWRVVGRHMMPLLLIFALFLSYGIDALIGSGTARLRSLAGKALAAAALTAMLASSIEIAYAERHQREDFRGAARLAGQYLARGDRVWWVAQSFGADYYRLPIIDPSACAQPPSQAAILLESPGSRLLADCPEPQVIFVGRYDTEGAVQRYAAERQFHRIGSLTGFEILGK